MCGEPLTQHACTTEQTHARHTGGFRLNQLLVHLVLPTGFSIDNHGYEPICWNSALYSLGRVYDGPQSLQMAIAAQTLSDRV